MLRYLLPAVLFAAAGVVYYVNNDLSTPQFIIPGVQSLSWVGDSKLAQAAASWHAFVVLGGLATIIMGISSFFQGSRDRRVNKVYDAAQHAQTRPSSAGDSLVHVDKEHPSNLVK